MNEKSSAKVLYKTYIRILSSGDFIDSFINLITLIVLNTVTKLKPELPVVISATIISTIEIITKKLSKMLKESYKNPFIPTAINFKIISIRKKYENIIFMLLSVSVNETELL